MTVKLIQIRPPERAGDPALEVDLGPFASEGAATAKAAELAVAFARAHSKTAPAPTYRIVPA